MSDDRGHNDVAIMLSGHAERLIGRIYDDVLRAFPSASEPVVNEIAERLGDQLPREATRDLVRDMSHLIAAIRSTTHRIPKLPRRHRQTDKQQFFLIALIGALQGGDQGVAIETAMAWLDTAAVRDVIRAADPIAKRLSALGLAPMPIARTTFEHVAGYPMADGFVEPPEPQAVIERRPELWVMP